MPYPELMDRLDADEKPDIVQNILKGRLPSSLKQLKLSKLVQVADSQVVAKALAQLKLQGNLPCLDHVVLSYRDALDMLMLGLLPWGLELIKLEMKRRLGEVFLKADVWSKVEKAVW